MGSLLGQHLMRSSSWKLVKNPNHRFRLTANRHKLLEAQVPNQSPPTSTYVQNETNILSRNYNGIFTMMRSKFLLYRGMIPDSFLTGVHCLDDKTKSILEDNIEYLRSRIEDVKERVSSIPLQRGKKRKHDDDDLTILQHWLNEAQKLVHRADICSTPQVGRLKSYLMGANISSHVSQLIADVNTHDKQGCKLLRREAVLGLIEPIPVHQPVGDTAFETLNNLESLLDGKIGRIAICGIPGIGKSFMMKHLCNFALDKFDHVFWVTIKPHFTIKNTLDAVASQLMFDFSADDNLIVRAEKLSNKLSELGNSVLFLDGVPGPDFFLDLGGNPVLAEGSKCKLVFTSSLALDCGLFEGIKVVEVKPLLEEEAYQLYMHAVRITTASVSSLDDVHRLFAGKCCGVPRMIIDVATCMCGIDDPHELRYELSELERLERKENSPFELVVHQDEPVSKRMKTIMVMSPSSLG